MASAFVHTDINNIIKKANDHWAGKSNVGNNCNNPLLWISCADSCVPELVVPNSARGDIFAYRNIANQFRADDISAFAILKYAVQKLQVDHIIVAGHTNCAGISASFKAAWAGPVALMTPLERWLAPVTTLAATLPLEICITPCKNGLNTDTHIRVGVSRCKLLFNEWNIEMQVAGIARALGALQSLDRPVHVHRLLHDISKCWLWNLNVSVMVGGSNGNNNDGNGNGNSNDDSNSDGSSSGSADGVAA